MPGQPGRHGLPRSEQAGWGAMGRVPWPWHCHEKLWRVSKGSGLAQKTAGGGGGARRGTLRVLWSVCVMLGWLPPGGRNLGMVEMLEAEVWGEGGLGMFCLDNLIRGQKRNQVVMLLGGWGLGHWPGG